MIFCFENLENVNWDYISYISVDQHDDSFLFVQKIHNNIIKYPWLLVIMNKHNDISNLYTHMVCGEWWWWPNNNNKNIWSQKSDIRTFIHSTTSIYYIPRCWEQTLWQFGLLGCNSYAKYHQLPSNNPVPIIKAYFYIENNHEMFTRTSI